MRTELRMASGASYTGTLRLVSEGGWTHARTSLLDFHLDSEQTPQFEEQLPEEAAYSCRRWLTMNPMETDLAASGEIAVRYTIRVPADALPRSYHCAAGFTTVPPPGQGRGIGLQTAVRVIGAFYVTVGTPAIQAHLNDIGVEPIPGSKDWRAVVVLENTGDVFFRPTGTMTVLDPDGKILETHEFIPVPVLPQRKQRLLFPLKTVSARPFSLRVRVDLGTGEIQEGTVIVPASQVSR